MEVKIEKLVYGGEGLGHHDGQTVFVPFVLPDEVVTIRAVDKRKKFVRGRVEQLLTPSPQRASPPCRHFGICGGCHYQHIPYDAQLAYKAEILRETLRRIGRVSWDGPITNHASPPFGYRNRAQWKIAPCGDPGESRIGYFQAGSTTLCPVEECPVLSPRLADTLAALRSMLASGKLPAKLREVEAFADSAGGKILLNASLERFEGPVAPLFAVLRDALPDLETILFHESSRDRYELNGPGFVYYGSADRRYRVGHLSFFQINRFLIEEIVRAVAAEESGRLALDLFAGVGLFTVPLAQTFERVVGVEADPAAARDLEANLGENKTAGSCVNADVELFLSQWKDTPDLVVLDPPRAGVPHAALTRLLRLAPQRITYLSCDPATLARDLATLTGSAVTTDSAARYTITAMHLFDLFPQTYHIETLVRLHRRE